MTNKDVIKVLDDRAQSRDKLPIWYGSRDNHVHGVKELIANAADELKNNATDPGLITVKLHSNDEELYVRDNGRGINIGDNQDGIPNYELLFRTLFAGTKYDVTDDIQTGTNGVGTTVLNYTSEKFEVRSWYSGKGHSLNFKDGGQLDEKGLYVADLPENFKNYHGTEVNIKLDKAVYTKTKFDPAIIEDIIHHFAVAATNITFEFIRGEGEDEVVKRWCYKNYDERMEEITGSTSTSSIFSLGRVELEAEYQKSQDGELIKEKNAFDIKITTSPEPVQEAYLNMTYLSEGGVINNGVLDGIRLYLNKYCREKNLFPKKVKAFNKEDIDSSITFIAVVESPNVEFSNQTKLSTSKVVYEKQAKEYVKEMLDSALLEDPKGFKKLVSHILEVQKHNTANDNARKKLKRKLSEKVQGIGGKVLKLVDCEKHDLNSELFISEGQSANGSIVMARDEVFQASYPLRGKALNVEKADIARLLANEEIIDLIRIIGAGVSTRDKRFKDFDEFDMSKARFGKIMIATDADPDGENITALVITIVWMLFRPFLLEGRLFIVKTPLYKVKLEDDTMIYFNSETEKDERLPLIKGKYVINRLKGLGEVSDKIMAETAMDPTTRTLEKVTVEDAMKANEKIIDWMGESVLQRKEMISQWLPNYVDASE